MHGKKLKSAVQMSKLLLPQFVMSGDVVIDATVGNGNDSIFLLDLIGETGFLYGFDVQKDAIDNTEVKLSKTYSNFKLIHDGHENVRTYVKDEIDFAIFNLGYLPKYDKTITTLWKTTKIAVFEMLDLLKPNGILSLMVYPGHEEGKLESKNILELIPKINQKYVDVVTLRFENQVNNPPYIILMEKKYKDGRFRDYEDCFNK